jgi:hypothetical protein
MSEEACAENMLPRQQRCRFELENRLPRQQRCRFELDRFKLEYRLPRQRQQRDRFEKAGWSREIERGVSINKNKNRAGARTTSTDATVAWRSVAM